MNMKPKVRRLLEWANRTNILESQVTASGLSAALNDALIAGYVGIEAHPTVRDGAAPAACVVITPAGRRALEGGPDAH